MLYTSAQAAKLLRKLNDEKNSLEINERQSCVFKAAITENLEDARPIYDYSKTQSEIDTLETKIRKLKHAINKFNVSQVVPGFDMTIDQMLIYIPQLTNKRAKLSGMKDRLEKQREIIRVAGIIEYSYANYDVEKAKDDFEKVSDELAFAQTALDSVNNSVEFEIEL